MIVTIMIVIIMISIIMLVIIVILQMRIMIIVIIAWIIIMITIILSQIIIIIIAHPVSQHSCCLSQTHSMRTPPTAFRQPLDIWHSRKASWSRRPLYDERLMSRLFLVCKGCYYMTSAYMTSAVLTKKSGRTDCSSPWGSSWSHMCVYIYTYTYTYTYIYIYNNIM